MSLFVLIGLTDLALRFFLLERSTWTCNEGIIWGIFLHPTILSIATGGFLFLLSWYFVRSEVFEERLFLLPMLLGGGTNALDRVFHGCVLDYFAWPGVLDTFLPNFNLADMMLLLGLFGLGGIFLSKKRQ